MKTLIAAVLLACITYTAQSQPIQEVKKPGTIQTGSHNIADAEQLKEPPPDFVPVEKQPVPILNPAPEYPAVARSSKIEGTAWVKLWIDESGKTRKAVVIKSDNDIFNKPSVDAALQWTFTPAMLNKKPVDVWVSIPFKFKLNQPGKAKSDSVKSSTAPAKKTKHK